MICPECNGWSQPSEHVFRFGQGLVAFVDCDLCFGAGFITEEEAESEKVQVSQRDCDGVRRGADARRTHQPGCCGAG